VPNVEGRRLFVDLLALIVEFGKQILFMRVELSVLHVGDDGAHRVEDCLSPCGELTDGRRCTDHLFLVCFLAADARPGWSEYVKAACVLELLKK
jgi:hypothetical protein